MNAEAHLTDVELAMVADATAQEAVAESALRHLDDCVLCRLRLSYDHGSANPVARGGDVTTAPIPEALRVGLSSREDYSAAEIGELWQLASEDTAVLGMIINVERSHALIVPVTFDPDMADEYTVIVDVDDSPLDLQLAIWAGLSTPVPLQALRCRVADLSGVLDIVSATISAYRDATTAEGVRVGTAVHILEARFVYRDELVNTLEFIAHSLTSGSPPSPAADGALDRSAQGLEEQDADTIKRRLKEVDAVDVLYDLYGETFSSALDPLRPLCVVTILDARVRVLLAEGVTSPAELDSGGMPEAVRVASLFRDCDLVAVVVPDEYLHTIVLNAADVGGAYTIPEGGRSEPNWHVDSAQPFEDALGRLAEWYAPSNLGFRADEVAISPGDATAPEVDEIAERNASAAIESRRGSRAQIVEKQAALESLSDTDAQVITHAVIEIAHGRSSDIEDLLAPLVEGEQ